MRKNPRNHSFRPCLERLEKREVPTLTVSNWTGAVSTTYSDGANWDGGVPGVTTDARFAAGTRNCVVDSNAAAETGEVEIASGYGTLEIAKSVSFRILIQRGGNLQIDNNITLTLGASDSSAQASVISDGEMTDAGNGILGTLKIGGGATLSFQQGKTTTYPLDAELDITGTSGHIAELDWGSGAVAAGPVELQKNANITTTAYGLIKLHASSADSSTVITTTLTNSPSLMVISSTSTLDVSAGGGFPTVWLRVHCAGTLKANNGGSGTFEFNNEYTSDPNDLFSISISGGTAEVYAGTLRARTGFKMSGGTVTVDAGGTLEGGSGGGSEPSIISGGKLLDWGTVDCTGETLMLTSGTSGTLETYGGNHGIVDAAEFNQSGGTVQVGDDPAGVYSGVLTINCTHYNMSGGVMTIWGDWTPSSGHVTIVGQLVMTNGPTLNLNLHGTLPTSGAPYAYTPLYYTSRTTGTGHDWGSVNKPGGVGSLQYHWTNVWNDALGEYDMTLTRMGP